MNTGQEPSDGRKGIVHTIFEHGAGWITAIVAVISLATGFGAGYSTGKTKSPAPAPAPTVTVHEPNPGSASPAPIGNGGSSSAPAVRHKDSLLLNDSYGADLDSTANNWDVRNTNTEDVILSQGSITSFAGQLAILDNGSQPDYQGCSSTTNYVQGNPGIPVSSLKRGSVFCIRTDQGRWSLIRMTNVSQSSISMVVTTWELAQ